MSEDMDMDGAAGADTGAQGEGLSLRDELAAALEGAAAGAAAADAGEAAGGADSATPAPSGFPPAAADDEITTGSPGPAGEPGPSEARTIAPPAAWSAAAKADWQRLPEHIREEVLKREADMLAGKAQWDQKAARLNRLDSVLGPRAERLRLSGLDESQAIQALFAAQDFLERDPVGALAYLARQSGVDLRALAEPAGEGAQSTDAYGEPGQLPPQFMALAEEVQSLRQAWMQQQHAAEEHVRGLHLDQVEAFAADPQHLHFETVRGAMGALLRSGQAVDLQDAYEQATWADPQVRPLLLRQQEERRQADARAKVQQAKAASGSVTGSPSPGASPGGMSSASTVREALQHAWDAHAA